jgi:predicted lactoylglutathione lyase
VKLARATLCLPIADRSVSHAFYTALGFEAFGDPADDGLPEPLQFRVSDGLRLMLIPRVGFGWVIGGRKRAPKGTHECQLLIALPTPAEVDDLLRRAHDAGAQPVFEAREQQWGYAGAFADPDGHQWQVSVEDGFLTR